MEKVITADRWPIWQVDNGFIVWRRLVRWQESGETGFGVKTMGPEA